MSDAALPKGHDFKIFAQVCRATKVGRHRDGAITYLTQLRRCRLELVEWAAGHCRGSPICWVGLRSHRGDSLSARRQLSPNSDRNADVVEGSSWAIADTRRELFRAGLLASGQVLATVSGMSSRAISSSSSRPSDGSLNQKSSDAIKPISFSMSLSR